jgi:sulfur carrier protein ThiS
MHITFKLFASLSDYLPVEAKYANQVQYPLQDNQTVQQLIEAFVLPDKLVHLVLVNGVYIYPEQRATHVLKHEDVLAIWPPIAGG